MADLRAAESIAVTTQPITDREKKLTIAAIMTVFLLSALDQTVVATAMPRIIAELHGLEMYSWTATAYMLTSTVMVPIYGKLGDMYGRKIILTVGVSIFLLGSALCGLAGEFGDLPLIGGGMVQLIFCRAIQGIGSGALFSGAFSVIGDLYPPRERGRIMGLFVAVFSISSVAGPTIGGFFTDHGTVNLLGYTVAGWRWVFYVNLPLGLASLFLIGFKMHRTNAPTGGRVDYWGAFFLILAFVPLLLALTWGGNRLPWDSTEIIALFATSLIALGVFVYIEAKVSDPIMPHSLMRNRAFAITNAAAFVISMAFFGVVMFMPLYMQLVLGVNATKSGFAMLPLMLGLMSTAMFSGRMVRRTGRYKPTMIVGCIVLFVGVVLLSQIGPATSIRDLNWRMLLVGLGLGPVQSLYSIAAQNAAPLNQLGIATSSSQFFRQIGSTVGIAIFGTVLTQNLMHELPARLPQMAMTSQKIDLGHMQAQAMNPGSVRVEVEKQMKKLGVPASEEVITAATHRIETGIKEGFSVSIDSMLKSALWIVGLGLLITLFIPVLPLRGGVAVAPAKEAKT